MLDALRKQATGWVAQIFIGLLVLSFAIWGVSGFFTGFYADIVASVGKTDISTSAFARQYDQALQAMGRQTGRPLTSEQAQLFGLPSQVLGRLVTQATLDDTARQYGLGLSNQMLAQKISEDPAFRGPGGGFNRLNFQQVLRNNGFTEDQYVTDQHAVLLRYQISNALVSAAHAPEPYLQALHQYRFEERSIEYVVLTESTAGDIAEPSETELVAYFEESRSQWRAPEYRALTLFEVMPADIAKPDEITDAEAQAAYDHNLASYTKAERRKVSQLVFDNREEATAAAEAIAGGKSFDEVAGERNLTAADTSLGLVAREQIIDPKVAEAAFALASGTTSEAIEGDFGWVVVRVDEVQPGEIRTFAEVKDEIKQNLAVELGRKRIIEIFDEVEDARAAGETFQEIADKIGAALRTIAAVDRSGNDMEDNRLSDLPAANDLLPAAFETDVGIENDAVRTSDGGYVWYEVTAITPERDRRLDEVRDKVVADWKRARIDERLSAEAEKVSSRAESGEPLDKIAEELGLPVKTALNLTRSSQPPADLTAAAIGAAFGGPQGHVAVTDATGGAKAVLVVTGVFVPPFNPGAPDLAQARRQISDQIANDYLQQFIVEKQSQLGVRVNQTVLQSIVGQARSGF
jgi:peptidyl-prolyl cis-trans isomerase D